MTDEWIAPGVIETAIEAYDVVWERTPPYSGHGPDLTASNAMEAAIRAADEARGLGVEIRRPWGGVPVQRHVSGWRPVERPS